MGICYGLTLYLAPASYGELARLEEQQRTPVRTMRNIHADPSVRKMIGRRWRTGTAHVMPNDDPRARQRAMPAATAAVDDHDFTLTNRAARAFEALRPWPFPDAPRGG